MKTRLAEPARKEARRMHNWWKANRLKAPTLFAEELADARRQIADAPELAPVWAVRATGTVVRRVLMPRTRTHVFYEVSGGVATIVALWGATKADGPEIP